MGSNGRNFKLASGFFAFYFILSSPRFLSPMDLTILFSPVDEALYSGVTSPSSFFKSIHAFTEKMPDYRGAHIALFGIKEDRGTYTNKGTASAPDEIRKKLYQLKKGTGAYRIVD